VAQDKLLLISCYFPPAGGIGVQRAVSLARYFPQNGFEVHVLTSRSSGPTVDPELLRQIPQNVKIHRTWTLEPPFYLRKKLWSRINPSGTTSSVGTGLLFNIKSLITHRIKTHVSPDPQVLWYPFAIRRAIRLVRRHGIQTVLVTAPPFSAFLILIELKRRFPHVCAIAEARDEWLNYFAKEFAFRDDNVVAARAAQIEKATIASCDRFVAVTQTSLEQTRARYPDEAEGKFVVIPNGYDPAAFSEFRPRSHGTGKLVVTYAGTIYKPSSPKTYLDALDGLSEIRSDFQTRFIGRIAEELDRSIFENRQSSIRLVDFVPHNDSLAFMEESDVLLLPWTDRANIPGKLFEYLATGKPILALCYRDSELARIMQETASGWCAEPSDTVAIQNALRNIYALRGQYPNDRNWEAIRRYERPRLAAEYARAIRGACPPCE
jgi:glycosyltransferase involved in cell wall biosynthesis